MCVLLSISDLFCTGHVMTMNIKENVRKKKYIYILFSTSQFHVATVQLLLIPVRMYVHHLKKCLILVSLCLDGKFVRFNLQPMDMMDKLIQILFNLAMLFQE